MRTPDPATRCLRVAVAITAAMFAVPPAASAQTQDTTVVNPNAPARMDAVVVTATRTEKSVFNVPTPVSVLDAVDIRAKLPNSPADLFRDLPGVDVVGVGPTQVRPSIRGQRGQRILLMEDGIRLNNSRRQQSFGELPALVDVNSLEQIEIVRGPASVLYGTDAIGGAVNMITRTPRLQGVHGGAGYRFSSADEQMRMMGHLQGRMGRLAFSAEATVRDADPYRAPAGTFGDITLVSDTTVFDTGVRDHSFEGYLGYDLSRDHDAFVRYERYSADTSGFGWVDPAAYAPGEADVQIRYPFQHFDKVSFGYHGRRLSLPFADRVNFTGYTQSNNRALTNDVFVSFGAPGAGLAVSSSNYTDVSTLGFRLEATKFALGRVLFTYGADFFRDRSQNTDSSTTTITGFGPPMVDTDNVPHVPNATFSSTGAFLQADVQVLPRLSIIGGARYQAVRAAMRETPGFTGTLSAANDQTVVGAANLIYRVSDNLHVLATLGRGFRSPNLVERFYYGITPEGAAYQVPNPNLVPETSFNVDLGARYRNRWVAVEAFAFRNRIRNGVRIAERGDSLNGLPAYWNVNVDSLEFVGVEASASAVLPLGFRVGGNYTHLSSQDLGTENNPIGDTFSDKFLANLEYHNPANTVWIAYDLRHNGRRKDVVLGGPLGDPPVGAVLPAFTTHSVRAGVTLLQSGGLQHRLTVAVTNLTNVLYAEFANASFFRPEPGRNVTLAYDVVF